MAIQFDADSIVDRLETRLSSEEDWKNILFYSTNKRLIDVFAEELAYDMQYDEMLTTECKWDLAQQVSSLMAEVHFFNYTPYRKTGASGNLRVSTSENFDATYGVTVEIDKYTIFSSGTYDFVCSETTELSIYDEYVDVPIVQGTPLSETFTAVGDSFEMFYIYNDSVENNIFDVYVNGIEWTQIDYIREADDGDSQVYEFGNLNDFSGVYIKFGNDSFGQKLTAGDTIVVKYLETAGEDGNISSAGLITTISSTIYDEDDNEVDCYCTNTETISGGTDVEDIEDIRANAPNSYQTGDRAISKVDYEAIVVADTSVEKATVWGETEINEDNNNLPGTYISASENMVYISAINIDGDAVTASQITTLRDTLDDLKPPTDIVEFDDPIFTYIVFTITAYISDTSYALSTVKANITTALEDEYDLTAMDFKQSVRYSDYVSLIDQVDGVDYHETTITLYSYFTFNSAYTADINLDMNNITESTVKIYVEDSTATSPSYTLIGTDDGSGNITGETGYTFSASTIDYDDGTGAITITDGLTSTYGSYTIKVVYGIDATSIVPTLRNQIVLYGDSDVTTEYED